MKLDGLVPGGPVWAELGTSDLTAARRFYSEMFGWRCETDPDPDAGGYTVAQLGDAAVAGLTPLFQKSQPVAWTVSFGTSDADVTARMIEEAGGRVLVGPMDVSDTGRFVVALDPGGASFQLWQAGDFPGTGLLNAPGSLGWVELTADDRARAESFYTTVFGWTVHTTEYYTQWGVGGADFGGMTTVRDEVRSGLPPHWLPYFAVADVDASAATAVSAGGTAVKRPVSAEDGPRVAVLGDPQGAAFGVYRAGDEA